jgi:hypothetical protein
MLRLTAGACGLALAAALLLVGGLRAEANDSTFGGAGSDLIPLKETRVRMAAEDIVLEQRGGRWHITARYTFENPTDAAVTLRLGFPEERCHPDADCAEDGGVFRGMVTSVRGEVVPQQTGTVSPESDWAPSLGRVFLYTVVFQPRERVEVVHRYNHAMSSSVDGRFVTYITRTGALWSGPIGSARFTIRALERPWVLLHSRSFKLSSYTEQRKDARTAVTELVFEMKDWTPTEDLFVGLYGAQFGVRCPGSLYFVGATPEEELREELRELSEEELRTCRNMPYAHHGYIFKDEALNAAFYRAAVEDGEETFRRVPWHTNPRYTPDLLTSQEHRYIKLIKQEEQRRARAKR